MCTINRVSLVAYRSIIIIVIGIFWSPELVWSHDASVGVVVIGSKGVSEEMIEQAYYYAHLLSLGHQVYIKISMRHWMPRGIQGFTVYQDDRYRGGVRQVHIFIGKRLTPSQQEKTLAHEIVHVKQFTAKRLVKCGEKYYRWDGGQCLNLSRVPYSNRAWEQEAIKRGNQLYEDFRRQELAQAHISP